MRSFKLSVAAITLTAIGPALAVAQSSHSPGNYDPHSAVDNAPSAVNNTPSAVKRVPSAVNRVPSVLDRVPSAVENTPSAPDNTGTSGSPGTMRTPQ